MDISKVYNYLLHAANRDSTLFLTFDDGDRYASDRPSEWNRVCVD